MVFVLNGKRGREKCYIRQKIAVIEIGHGHRSVQLFL